jgi:hypothetical protein
LTAERVLGPSGAAWSPCTLSGYGAGTHLGAVVAGDRAVMRRPVLVAAAALVVVASAGATHLAIEQGDGPSGGREAVPDDGPAGELATGLTKILGEATEARARVGRGAILPTPLTMTNQDATAPTRVHIRGALVDGERRDISWSGASPLVVSGSASMSVVDGSFALDGTGAGVDVDGGGIRLGSGVVDLDGQVVIRRPDDQEALGGDRVERVSLLVDKSTTMEGFGPVHLELRGDARVEVQAPIELRGDLTVGTSDGLQHATDELRIESGSAVLVVDPTRAVATVEEPVSGVVEVGSASGG